MCGVAGYVGPKKAGPILLNILKRLEYRGYDSAGVAVIDNGKIFAIKSKGTTADLEKKYLKRENFGGCIGIGHTRWATHGKPTIKNAHPHISGHIAVVHNGIVENYQTLKNKLIENGFKFKSDNDSEVLAHLINYYYNGDLADAVSSAIGRVVGSYALIALSVNAGMLVCATKDAPLVIGNGVDGNYVASDIYSIAQYTNKIMRMVDNTIAIIEDEKSTIIDPLGRPVILDYENVDLDLKDDGFFNYPHFMLKEIHEQPKSFQDTLSSVISTMEKDITLDIGLSETEIRSLESAYVVASGTSYHAGLMTRYLFPQTAGIMVNVETASEFRYIEPRPNSLFIAVTQSGETADVLASLKKARDLGLRTLAITNVKGSTVTELADKTIYTRCGPEFAVAATKTFTAQIAVLLILAIKLGLVNGVITSKDAKIMVSEAEQTPRYIQYLLEKEADIQKVAEQCAESECCFFIGREYLYPAAREGALKMEEIAYITSIGYPAGELKHGPLALVTDKSHVVALATYGRTIRSNIKEVQARGGDIIAFVSEGDTEVRQIATKVIEIPKTKPIISAVLCSVAVQLLAYYTAKEKGLQIDKPRNLAKSVTVK
ncbi:glutamine--fructose-6-phosphate transaminase (isomerizing) [Candidatus Micrarchaeota archaeon]|jgi:glucosamine--fructose-6-phosphate aminotransferase (isomerizing)|nr:glutamine--fructose-6-phosphate transaminase (isomerizing) [Candidatus Micrarchaeota archaeon]